MAFNITQFTSDIRNRGVSKESQFEVRIFFPDTLIIGGQFAGGLDAGLTLRAESASIPGRTSQTIDDARDVTGPVRKIGYAPIYVPMDITFLCDEELNVKEKMDSWMDIILGNHRVAGAGQRNSTKLFNPGYYSDYIGTIDILKFNETGEKVVTTRLLEAYPFSIALLNLSWESEALQKLQVQFQYRYYEQLNVKDRDIPRGEKNRTPEGTRPAQPGPIPEDTTPNITLLGTRKARRGPIPEGTTPNETPIGSRPAQPGPIPEGTTPNETPIGSRPAQPGATQIPTSERNFGSFGPVPEVPVTGPRGLPNNF
jgi:hypothetical protein